MMAKRRRQTLFHLSWECAHWSTQIPHTLHVSMKDRESIRRSDLVTADTFQWMGKFTNTESMNSKDWFYFTFYFILFYFFKFIYFEREREHTRIHTHTHTHTHTHAHPGAQTIWGGAEKGTERQSQAGSAAQSPMWDLIRELWDHVLTWNQE